MKFIQKIDDNYSNRLILAGGKGSNLHKLVHWGFNVPPGIIVNSKAFEVFLKQNNLYSIIRKELQLVKVTIPDTIVTASKNIKKCIFKANFPDDFQAQLEDSISHFSFSQFAIRSSGVFEDNREDSWAGQFDSFLRVKKDFVLDKIKECWASFFNARAISYDLKSYRSLNRLKFAVIIQKMIEGDKSGIAFSIDPRGGDQDKILIEASIGSGEGLVSGQTVPFAAFYHKKEKILLSKSSSSQNASDVMSISEIEILSESILRLEKKFLNAVDVEWVIEKNKLYFLQVRPITTSITSNKKYQNINKKRSIPEIDDYELTFKVSGLSFLFSDMLAHGFRYLDPLFTSDKNGEFRQYFSNKKMEYASRYGMKWLSKELGFIDYKEKFERYYTSQILELERIVNSKKISKSSTFKFFNILSTFFTFYSKMDNQFTNLPYVYMEENKNIRRNLKLLSQFKDPARLWINKTSIEFDSHLAKFITKISNEFQMKIEDIECYKIEELRQLFHGRFLKDVEIEARRMSYTMFYSGKTQMYLTGDKSIEFIKNSNVREKLFASSEMKGQVAHETKKIIEGIVCVINVDYGNLKRMNREISAMKKGEILVAEFTAPEMMVACRKAKAIITDIGGLLSHAAIVSRELNIPCLVGTKNATKHLKSGDSVIIDFGLGIVSKH